MSGNAISDSCLLRGGGMHAAPSKLLCSWTGDMLVRSAETQDWGGIRCCSDQK